MTTHPTCQTCDHWRDAPRAVYNARPLSFNVCMFAKMMSKAVTHEPPDYETQLLEKYKDNRMFVMDAEEYHAELQTRGDFYCPHHSAIGVTP